MLRGERRFLGDRYRLASLAELMSFRTSEKPVLPHACSTHMHAHMYAHIFSYMYTDVLRL